MAFSWNRRKADDAYLSGLPEVGFFSIPPPSNPPFDRLRVMMMRVRFELAQELFSSHSDHTLTLSRRCLAVGEYAHLKSGKPNPAEAL
jgi:hypothetical protein